MTFKILTLDAIADKGLNLFDKKKYGISTAHQDPDAILVRSTKMLDMTIPTSVKVIGRAGTGVNNIPIDKMTDLGIPVLNSPGANSNAVKELVIVGMLLACRNICQAWDYTRQLNGDDHQLNLEVEKNKKAFRGTELTNKTLAVIGLGNIGVKVANAALGLGMKVIGFDEQITIKNSWQLSPAVKKANSLTEACLNADFISLHIPLLENTRHLIDAALIMKMKKDAILLNFSRNEIIKNSDLKAALNQRKIDKYICDFPASIFQQDPNVITLPHLGASTKEAEENCASMVSENVQAYLENGNLIHSVNLPDAHLPVNGKHRLTVINRNVPGITAKLTAALSKQNINILDILKKSTELMAYQIFNLDSEPTQNTLMLINAIEGIVRTRKIQIET